MDRLPIALIVVFAGLAVGAARARLDGRAARGMQRTRSGSCRDPDTAGDDRQDGIAGEPGALGGIYAEKLD